MNAYNINPFFKSFSNSTMPSTSINEPLPRSEDFYLNKQLNQEETAQRTKKAVLKKELAQFISQHEQSRVPNLYNSRKCKEKLTGKIGGGDIKQLFPSLNNALSSNQPPNDEIHITKLKEEQFYEDYQRKMNRLNDLGQVMSNQRSDDLRFNDLEYNSLLAKESLPRAYDDYNNFLNNYIDSLMIRNNNYLDQVLNHKEVAKQKKQLEEKAMMNSPIINQRDGSTNQKYYLGQSNIKDNHLAINDMLTSTASTNNAPNTSKQFVHNGRNIINH